MVNFVSHLFAAMTTDPPKRADLRARYETIRRASEQLCACLATEDYVVQTDFVVSPPKWHLAHTSWFWDQFLLTPHLPDYIPYDPRFLQVFNSYYVSLGRVVSKTQRGAFSRPTVAEVFGYRQHIDRYMHQLFERLDEAKLANLEALLELGLNHEQQHFELLCYDIKHIFFTNSVNLDWQTVSSLSFPVQSTEEVPDLNWIELPQGVVQIGHTGPGFCFDNEQPAHRVFLEPCALADRLTTNAEYARFVAEGGYRQSRWWLADGWARCQSEGWQAPLYWIESGGRWYEYTAAGLEVLEPLRPVSHLSFYEADAFARWAGCRLPTEFEWEAAARRYGGSGLFFEGARGLLPVPASSGSGLRQLEGWLWQWTQSAYTPYPGYCCVFDGPDEYNGKFMVNQLVLRGGSVCTLSEHYRPTYRNFFYPHDRWACTGLRLARSLDSIA